MSSGMMDTEAGGEQSQYESVATHMKPLSKQGGQMGTPETENDTSSSAEAAEKDASGAKAAENARYGQNISEGGMGGKTAEAKGGANSGMRYQSASVGVPTVLRSQGLGYGGEQSQATDDTMSAEKTRSSQGYGPGSGVGA